MTILFRWLGIRAEDRRKLLLMGPIFMLGGVAELLTYTAFMALFAQRFGLENIPLVYVAEALLLPAEAWFFAYLAERLSKPNLMRTQYAIFTGIVAANALVLLLIKYQELDWLYYYPVLFITSNFVVRQQTVLFWALAYDLCPTQQAKRLMPLFIAMATIGGLLGGVIPQIVGRFGAEWVYLLAPVFLAIGIFPFRTAIARYLVPLTLNEAESEESATDPKLRTVDYFRMSFRSPFLLCAIALMTLMPALMFLNEYIYMNVASIHFPDETELTEFYGMIFTILFGLALVLQLVSGRLTAWLGASNTLVAIAGIILLGFALTSAFFPTALGLAAVAVSFILNYLFFYYFAEPSFQLYFRMLPLEQRDGFRFVAQGIAGSGGILLGAMLQLLHATDLVRLHPMAFIGVALATALAAIAWFGRILYVRELVASIQGKAFQMSETVIAYLGGLKNGKAIQSVLQFLHNPNVHVRVLALEMLKHARVPGILPHLVELVDDPSPSVRIAALRAMPMERADIGLLAKVASFLEDPNYEVRAEAVKRVSRANHLEAQAFYFLRLKLLDVHPVVVAEAVQAIYALDSRQSFAACDDAIILNLEKGGEFAVQMCHAVGACRLERFSEAIALQLDDSKPAVRVAAVRCLGRLGAIDAIPKMLEKYPLADQEFQIQVRQALSQMGDRAIEPLRAYLKNRHPIIWGAVVQAMAGLLPAESVKSELVEACLERMRTLHEDASLAAVLHAAGLARYAPLANQRYRELRSVVLDSAWKVCSKLADEDIVDHVRHALNDKKASVRDNGMEVLAEGLGDRRLSMALLESYAEQAAAAAEDGVHSEEEAAVALAEYAQNADHWMRLIAFLAKGRRESGAMNEQWSMDQFLDKVMFLKQTPMFSELSLEELGLIAEIAHEETIPEHGYLLQAGKANEKMYLVVEGQVELNVDEVGSQGTIGLLGPNEVVGDSTVLSHAESVISGRAVSGQTRVLAFSSADLIRLIRMYPDIGLGLLQASSAKVRRLEAMVTKQA